MKGCPSELWTWRDGGWAQNIHSVKLNTAIQCESMCCVGISRCTKPFDTPSRRQKHAMSRNTTFLSYTLVAYITDTINYYSLLAPKPHQARCLEIRFPLHLLARILREGQAHTHTHTHTHTRTRRRNRESVRNCKGPKNRRKKELDKQFNTATQRRQRAIAPTRTTCSLSKPTTLSDRNPRPHTLGGTPKTGAKKRGMSEHAPGRSTCSQPWGRERLKKAHTPGV